MAYVGTQTDSNAEHVPLGSNVWGTSNPRANIVQSCGFSDGGTAGVTGEVITLNSFGDSGGNPQNSYFMESVASEPGSATSWYAPTTQIPWSARINVTTGQTDVALAEVHVVRLNSAGVYQETLVSSTGLGIATVGGLDHTETWTSGNAGGTAGDAVAAGDRIGVVWAFTNAAGVALRMITVTPNRDIDSPVSGAVLQSTSSDTVVTQFTANQLLAGSAVDTGSAETVGAAGLIHAATGITSASAEGTGDPLAGVLGHARCSTSSNVIGNPDILTDANLPVTARADDTSSTEITAEIAYQAAAESVASAETVGALNVVRAAGASTSGSAESIADLSLFTGSPIRSRESDTVATRVTTTVAYQSAASTTATATTSADATILAPQATGITEAGTNTQANPTVIRGANGATSAHVESVANALLLQTGIVRTFGARAESYSASGLSVARTVGVGASSRCSTQTGAIATRIRSAVAVAECSAQTEATLFRTKAATAIHESAAATIAPASRTATTSGSTQAFVASQGALAASRVVDASTTGTVHLIGASSKIGDTFLDDVFCTAYAAVTGSARRIRTVSAESQAACLSLATISARRAISATTAAELVAFADGDLSTLFLSFSRTGAYTETSAYPTRYSTFTGITSCATSAYINIVSLVDPDQQATIEVFDDFANIYIRPRGR